MITASQIFKPIPNPAKVFLDDLYLQDFGDELKKTIQLDPNNPSGTNCICLVCKYKKNLKIHYLSLLNHN